ncbi:MAG: hypothetical protein AAGF28_02340 [Pseudomonadota bacterium]
MIRIIDAALVTAVICGAVWTYQIKHEADQSAKRIKSLNAQIAAQERKTALLEADWAIEIDPARLEKIARQFESQLKLRPLDSNQIVTMDELPGFRPPPEAENGETLADQGGDITTGGIEALIRKEEANQ